MAVGGPSDWASSEPLPQEAVLIDLLAISIEEPKRASVLWNRFIIHGLYKAGVSKSFQYKRIFVPWLIKLSISVKISCPHINSAVVCAIKKSELGFTLEFI